MQCQICKKNDATIHLTEISEGVRSEMHLCEQCAGEQGITVKSHLSLNELLSGLLAAQPADDESSDLREGLTCPHCGFTLEHLRREAVVGCADDYEIFEKSLLPLIEKTQDGQTFHCGKVPSKAPAAAGKQIELITLRQQLKAAVESEDYERAAALRDKIAAIESSQQNQAG